MICSSEKRFFTSNLLLVGDWTPNRCATQKRGGVDTYLLTCYRYIELNPVRAGMVADAGDYPWSSHRRNALGAHDPGITPHPRYLALGQDTATRLRAYQAMFREAPNAETQDALRAHTRQNKAFGNDRFRQQIETLVGRSMAVRSRGRPRSAPEQPEK